MLPPMVPRTATTMRTSFTRLSAARGLARRTSGHAHRDYAEIKRLLARARLDADAGALAFDIFARIADV